MYRRRVQAVGLELRCQPVRAVLGAGENQHLPPVLGADLVGQELPLAVAVDRVDDLAYAFCGPPVYGDLYLYR